MELVSLLGSPKPQGNSCTIAKLFCTAAERLGAEVRTFALNDLDYRGCQGCMACKTKLEQCALEDDLTEVVEAVCETDVLVLASPVYYGDVSSQLNICSDRSGSHRSTAAQLDPSVLNIIHTPDCVENQDNIPSLAPDLETEAPTRYGDESSRRPASIRKAGHEHSPPSSPPKIKPALSSPGITAIPFALSRTKAGILPGLSSKTRVAASIRSISPGASAALATAEPNRRKKLTKTGTTKYFMAGSFMFGL